MIGATQVIVVPDDDAEALQRAIITPGMLAQLDGDTVLMSNNSLRMYVRAATWEAMKDSFKLTAK